VTEKLDKEFESENSANRIDTKDLSFEELIEYRKSLGYRVYGVELLDVGVIIDRAFYKDITWECIEELADACVYLGFEETKLRSLNANLEARRINTVVNSVKTAATILYEYRERVYERYPELFKESLEDEIRAGNISEVRSS